MLLCSNKRARADVRMCVHVCLPEPPAIKFRRIGQGKLFSSTLNSRVGQGIHRRHLSTLIPFALPSLRHMHASPRCITAQELHVALLAEPIGFEEPCESEHRLLRQTLVLSNGPIVPVDKHKSCERESERPKRCTNKQRCAQLGTRTILSRRFGPAARAAKPGKPRLNWQRSTKAIAHLPVSPWRAT